MVFFKMGFAENLGQYLYQSDNISSDDLPKMLDMLSLVTKKSLANFIKIKWPVSHAS